MRNLFRSPSAHLAADLDAAIAAIAAATPLNTLHSRELPYAVRDLSRLLTQERSRLSSSYWINKRLLTAYCRYFLPWNLVRLAWLLPSLDLALQPGDTVLDLGSGPLTLPLALWIAHPQWRTMPLTFVCSDIAPNPMATGREIFHHLDAASPWKIELRRSPMQTLLRSFSGKAALITAGNVLNESRSSREHSLEDRLGELAAAIASRLAPHGRLLLVEPGTRLGGKLISLFRHAAFASSLMPESPCTHWNACPMLAERATGWCHFSHTLETIPRSLADLTRLAKLEKQALNISCLLLRHATEEENVAAQNVLRSIPLETGEDDWDDAEDDAASPSGNQALRDAWASAYAATRQTARPSPVVRVLSDPIRLPGTPEPARYGCSCKGLTLVHNALRIPSGAALDVRWPEEEQRDPKTGAYVVTLPKQAPSVRPEATGTGKRSGTRPVPVAPSAAMPPERKEERPPSRRRNTSAAPTAAGKNAGGKKPSRVRRSRPAGGTREA